MPADAFNAIPYFREIVIFLVVAVVVVPLFGRLKVSPILGFLIAGVVIGPYGFKAIDGVEEVRHLAELGIVFLLFKIGLELSLDRLIQLRRLVFGLGSAQVLVTGLAITGIAFASGNSPGAAIVIGFALALSSTAIVMRLLIERNAITSAYGRASFSVLLFQDKDSCHHSLSLHVPSCAPLVTFMAYELRSKPAVIEGGMYGCGRRVGNGSPGTIGSGRESSAKNIVYRADKFFL